MHAPLLEFHNGEKAGYKWNKCRTSSFTYLQRVNVQANYRVLLQVALWCWLPALIKIVGCQCGHSSMPFSLGGASQTLWTLTLWPSDVVAYLGLGLALFLSLAILGTSPGPAKLSRVVVATLLACSGS